MAAVYDGMISINSFVEKSALKIVLVLLCLAAPAFSQTITASLGGAVKILPAQ